MPLVENGIAEMEKNGKKKRERERWKKKGGNNSLFYPAWIPQLHCYAL